MATVQSKEEEQNRIKEVPSGIWVVPAGFLAAAGLRRYDFSAHAHGCTA